MVRDRWREVEVGCDWLFVVLITLLFLSLLAVAVMVLG